MAVRIGADIQRDRAEPARQRSNVGGEGIEVDPSLAPQSWSGVGDIPLLGGVRWAKVSPDRSVSSYSGLLL